jgi:hypothetical protein
MALSISPLASSKAFLQSIMPCPDIFRNFTTIDAEISAILSTPVLLFAGCQRLRTCPSRWSRSFAGVPVRGNRSSDHVAVLVGPDGVAAWSTWWPELAVLPASSPGGEELLAAGAALRDAGDELSRSVKGTLRLQSARPVYGTRGPGSTLLVPAWEFRDATGAGVVVDALTGDLLL